MPKFGKGFGHNMKNIACGIVGDDQILYHKEGFACDELKAVIHEQLEIMIGEHGVTEFISGMHRGPEMFAAEIVLELKKRHPFTLWGILESEEQWIHWTEAEQNHFFDIMEQADYEYRASSQTTVRSRQRQLRVIAEESDILIVIQTVISGAMLETLMYARRHGKRVLWIEPESMRVMPYME